MSEPAGRAGERASMTGTGGVDRPGGAGRPGGVSNWLPCAPCTPESCVSPPGPVVGVWRRLLRGAGCASVLVVGVALAPVVRGRGRAVGERLVSCWARTLVASLGIRLRPTHGPPDGPTHGAAHGPTGGPTHGGGVLLVANHVSWLDILLIAAVLPGRMLAKTELRGWPLLGPLAAWGGTIFIDRDRLRALPGTVEEIAAALRRGERVVVFPEGSTWCGRNGGRFRPALFQAAVEAGAAVQPVAVRYRLADGSPTTTPAFVGEDGLLSSLRRVVAVRGLAADVLPLALIPAGRYPTRRSLARAAQAAVDRHRFASFGDAHGGCAARAAPGHLRRAHDREGAPG
ncbi:lysophospholipid acyltransferase family protein [Kitasatospora sp. NPDC056138]|uniref:lysophospholipid acyltransferase family protein n=1 Tax=Kitasatospora sp. NPDC056138 TaxID=3345724 RepID=UPI0035DF79BB